MKPEMEHVPEFEAEQLLGRAVYRPLFRNDQFLNAFADRMVAAPCVSGRAGMVWDGYVWKDADHSLLNYAVYLFEEPGYSSRLYLVWDYDLDTAETIVDPQETGWVTGTFDASAKADGVHRLACYVTNVDPNHPGSGICLPPYMTYTGSLAFVLQDTPVDGQVPTAAVFNGWRSNDLFFESQLSPNHAFIKRSASGGTTIWDGYVRYDETCPRIFYRASIDSYGDTDHFRLIGTFDYDNAVDNQRFAELRADMDPDVESYYDLTAAYVHGTAYHVVWKLVRESSVDPDPNMVVYYTHMGASGPDAAFTVPGELAVEQYVQGMGGDTAATLLSSNDTALDDRAGLAYRQYGVPSAVAAGYSYTFIRQGDYLYYRGTALELAFGDASTVTLDDYADPGTPYQVLDLRTVDGLLHGMMYEVSSDGGDLQWACEFLEEP